LLDFVLWTYSSLLVAIRHSCPVLSERCGGTSMCKLCCLLIFAISAGDVAGETFKVTFAVDNLEGGGTGHFVVEVHPAWAPKGAQRFAELVQSKFFDNVRFFRVIDGFMAQFGISGDPAVATKWRDKKIKDDAVKKSNSRGRLTFATSGPNSRTTQIFINFGGNYGLDQQGFAPFAEVVEGMDIVDKLYKGYGEGAPSGNGPSQMLCQSKGNAYLQDKFPKLSFIKSVIGNNDLGAISAAAVAPGPNDIPTVSGQGHGLTIFAVFSLMAFVLVLLVARSSRWKGPNSSNHTHEENTDSLE